MSKAILELEMPENCRKCPCSWLIQDSIIACEVTKHYCPEEGRHKNCPLKLVEERFIEFPCKIGDTIYIVYGKGKILETKVDLRAWTDDDGWILRTKEGHFSGKYIGKEIFFTREEAEKIIRR